MNEDDRRDFDGDDPEAGEQEREAYRAYEGYPPDEYNIGELLERTRKKKGLSLQDVEDATKIRKRYIQGLESEDYTVLPDSVYAQGFLKTYANYLGLDGNELSSELKNRRGRRREKRQPGYSNLRRNSQTTIRPGGISEARRSSISPPTLFTVILAVVVILVVVGALYFIGRGGLPTSSVSGGDQASESPAPNASPEVPAGAEPDPAQPKDDAAPDSDEPENPEGQDSSSAGAPSDGTPAADGLTVEISIRNQRSWVSVTADESVEYAQVARPGFSESFEAERVVSINAGNAGNVLVTVNGQDVGALGEDGETLVRDFTLKDAS